MIAFPKSLTSNFDAIAAAAVLMTVIVAGAAIVSESLATRQTLAFPQSNLASAAGVAEVYANIKAAAYEVCAAGQPRVTRPEQIQNCTKSAEARAVKQLNAGALTAYFQHDSEREAGTFASNLTK